MAEPRLVVRSAKARSLALRIARRENRSLAAVVERALEAYESSETGREPATVFYARISAEFGTGDNLEALIEDHRQPHKGRDL